jgi:hypothetical protein
MANCRVFREVDPNIRFMTVNPDGTAGPARPARRWVGVCELCKERVPIPDGRWRSRGVTRKVVRDALYRHGKQRHAGPGGTR